MLSINISSPSDIMTKLKEEQKNDRKCPNQTVKGDRM